MRAGTKPNTATVAVLLSALKTRSLQQTICLVSMIVQVLLTCLLGCSAPIVQWVILIVGLSTITPDNGLSTLSGDDFHGPDDHVLSGHGTAAAGIAHLPVVGGGTVGAGIDAFSSAVGGGTGGGGGTIIFQSAGHTNHGAMDGMSPQMYDTAPIASATAAGDASIALGAQYGLSAGGLATGGAMRARVVPGRRPTAPGAIPRSRRIKSGSRP